MTKRELVYNIFDKKNTSGKIGFWSGRPAPETIHIYNKILGLDSLEEFEQYMGCDCRWIPADEYMKVPQGFGINTKADNAPQGCGMNEYCRFADAETKADIDAYKMPDARDIDFAPVYKVLDNYRDTGVFTGIWACFFHIVADLFGMEEYFVRLYTDPDLVLY
ncbi:MAG: hypothetical protein KBT47_03175, partial [Armatimonadetes bacterium]|nr:hypothetical protein [Candidatus Hippobium faecium]